jgi:hypothetical protein
MENACWIHDSTHVMLKEFSNVLKQNYETSNGDGLCQIPTSIYNIYAFVFIFFECQWYILTQLHDSILFHKGPTHKLFLRVLSDVTHGLLLFL